MLLPVQDELELLVSSTADGQLVLSDCFCLDTVVSNNCLGVRVLFIMTGHPMHNTGLIRQC